MAIIIKGDNHGIAVDGNLKIEHLDFAFGQGVKSVSGVQVEAEEAEIVEQDSIPVIDDRRDDYPIINKEQVEFFEPLFNVSGVQPEMLKQKTAEFILHRIYTITPSWSTTSSVRKWRILYEYLKRNKAFRVIKREKYSAYVKAVIAYCFPDVQDKYSNNLSKVELPDSYVDWDNEDKDFYQRIKLALPLEYK